MRRRIKRPLKIMQSPLTGQYYAFRTYRMRTPTTLEITGVKEDVTAAIEELFGKERARVRLADGSWGRK